MRYDDFTKIASINVFDIFFLESNTNRYILKHFRYEDMAHWDVVAEKESCDEIMAAYNTEKAKYSKSVLFYKGFSTFDLIELDKYFKIWKWNYQNGINLEEFDSDTLKWNVIKTFANLIERTSFILPFMDNPDIIIVEE